MLGIPSSLSNTNYVVKRGLATCLAAVAAEQWDALFAAGCLLHVLTDLVVHAAWS